MAGLSWGRRPFSASRTRGSVLLQRGRLWCCRMRGCCTRPVGWSPGAPRCRSSRRRSSCETGRCLGNDWWRGGAGRRRAAGPAEDQGVLAVRGLVEHIASVRAGDPVSIEPLDAVEHVTDPSWAKMPDLSVEAAHLRAEVLASHPEAGRRAGSEVQWEEALRRLLEHHHRVPIGGRAGSRGRAACACRGSTTSPSRCPSTAPDTPPAAQVQVRAEGAAGEHRVERGFEEAVSLAAPQAHRPLGERHRAEELDTAQLRRGPGGSSRGANQQRRPRAVPRRSSSRPAGCTRSGPNTRGCAEPRTLA